MSFIDRKPGFYIAFLGDVSLKKSLLSIKNWLMRRRCPNLTTHQAALAATTDVLISAEICGGHISRGEDLEEFHQGSPRNNLGP